MCLSGVDGGGVGGGGGGGGEWLAILRLFMPPTSKKLRGHIGLILSVCPLRFLADTIS